MRMLVFSSLVKDAIRACGIYFRRYLCISGGYNLHVDTQVQREPKNEYLFKENGSVIKIPPIKPCRVHFGDYSFCTAAAKLT